MINSEEARLSQPEYPQTRDIVLNKPQGKSTERTALVAEARTELEKDLADNEAVADDTPVVSVQPVGDRTRSTVTFQIILKQDEAENA